MSAQAWREALNDYGRALLDFEHRYEREGHAATPFSHRLPSGLGPMPTELLDIAVSLVSRSHESEERIREAMATITAQRRNIRQARAHMSQDRPTAHFVDVRG